MPESMPDAGTVSPSKGAATSRVRFWIAVLASLAGIAILCGLGIWQVERLAWKEGLIRQIEERTHLAPVPLSEIERRFSETGDVEYWPVRLSGRFLHADERHFLSTFEEQAGWNVFTPLLLDDGRIVFVNRGFVPYDLKDPARRQAGEVAGRVEITGLARNPLAGKPSSMTPDNDTKANVFFWKTVPDMSVGLSPEAAAKPVLPFFVDAGPGRAPGGYPVGGVTIVDMPNTHLQYAMTWFGLAAVLAVMLVLFLLRSRRPSEGAVPLPNA